MKTNIARKRGKFVYKSSDLASLVFRYTFSLGKSARNSQEATQVAAIRMCYLSSVKNHEWCTPCIVIMVSPARRSSTAEYRSSGAALLNEFRAESIHVNFGSISLMLQCPKSAPLASFYPICVVNMHKYTGVLPRMILLLYVFFLVFGCFV